MNQDSTETELGTSDSETSGIYFPNSKTDEEMSSVCNDSNLSVNDSLVHSYRKNSVEVEEIIRQGCREFMSGCSSPNFYRSPYLLRSSLPFSPTPGPSRQYPHQAYYYNEDFSQNRTLRRKIMSPSDFKTNFPMVDFRRRKFKNEGFFTDNKLSILYECEKTNNSVAREEKEEECSISVNGIATASGRSYINRHLEEREETHNKNPELSCFERAIPTTSLKNDHIENSGEPEVHPTDENSLINNYGKYQEGVSDLKGLSIKEGIPKLPFYGRKKKKKAILIYQCLGQDNL